MKDPSKTQAHNGAVALQSRRRFLKRALLTAAYVTPIIISYPSRVFAAHCVGATGLERNQNCGGNDHRFGGMTWSPGCTLL